MKSQIQKQRGDQVVFKEGSVLGVRGRPVAVLGLVLGTAFLLHPHRHLTESLYHQVFEIHLSETENMEEPI